MVMPRIWPAICSASAAVPASLMPPALPRLPVGTCALTTQGPICVAAFFACAAVVHRMPRGIGIPAGPSTSDFAACSSKFIMLSAVFRPVGAEQVGFLGLVFRNGGDEMGYVEEIHIIHIVGDAVAAPGATAHAEREVQAGIEAATVGKCMRLIDQYANHIRLLRQLAGPVHVLGMQPDRVAAALMREDFISPRHSGVEIFGAVNGQHQR